MRNFSADAVAMGLDLSDRSARFCCLNAKGEVTEDGAVALTHLGLESIFGGRERLRVVLEAGTHSPWVSRVIDQMGHEVIVANPRQLPLIFRSQRKTDRHDAEQLARIGRLDPSLLCPIQHRGEEAQADLAVLRSREALVRTRTSLVNHVKGSVKAVGGRIKGCSTESFHKRALEHIPTVLLPALRGIVETIGVLSAQIAEFDRANSQMCDVKYPESALLRQVAGVGPLTALAYMLVIEEHRRFRKSRQVPAYLGLIPRLDQSGAADPQLRITKSGDGMLRRLLVGSAQYILGPFGPDTDLRRWGLALAERGGMNAKKRAVVAVARKLSVLLHHLWKNADVYEPLRRPRAAT